MFTFVLSDAFHSFQGSQKKNRQLVFKLSHIDTPNYARSACCWVSNTQSGKWPQRCAWPRLTQQSLPWAPSPGQPHVLQLDVEGLVSAPSWASRRGASTRRDRSLLCGDKFHNHADDPWPSRTGAQIYAWVFYLILEELVKFTTKFLY